MSVPAISVPVGSEAEVKGLAGIVCTIRNTDTTPTAVPVVRIETTGTLRSASRALVRGGFLFASLDTARPSDKPQPEGDGLYYWMPHNETLESWLQVVDLRPSVPVVRDPVSIPGDLLSVDQVDAQGAVVVTNSERWVARRNRTDRTLQALAYDGSSAYLLHSLATTSPYGSASASNGTRIFLASESPAQGVVAVGYDPVAGKLLNRGRWDLATPASLHTFGSYVLAANTGTLDLARVDAAGALSPLGSYETPTNLWLQLDRTAIEAGRGIYIPAGAYGVESLPWRALSRQAAAKRRAAKRRFGASLDPADRRQSPALSPTPLPQAGEGLFARRRRGKVDQPAPNPCRSQTQPLAPNWPPV